MTSKIATNKFAAAALAVLIGAGFTAPAFAQQGQPSLGAKAAEQAAPKAADKAGSKVQHGTDKAKADAAKTKHAPTAKQKAGSAKAKDAVKKADKPL